MMLVLLVALAFIVVGALTLAQALGLGQFIGRALVPNFVIGLAGVAFLAAGTGILWKAFGGSGATRNVNARILHSEEGNAGMLKLWLGMALYLALIGILDYVFLVQGGRDVPPVGWAVLGLFTLAGIGGAATAALKTLEWLKYGSVLLYLDAPARTGGKLQARIKLPEKLRAATHLSASLSCIASARVRDANNRSSTESDTTRWTESRSFPIHWIGVIGQAQLQLEIPFEFPATDLSRVGEPAANRPRHRWELKLIAEVPGIDLNRTFNVHVAPGKAPGEAMPLEGAARVAAGVVPVATPKRPSVMIQSSDIPVHLRRPARIVAGIVGTIFFLWFFGFGDVIRHFRGSEKNQWPAAVAGPFEMKPDEFQQALRLFASGVKLEQHGDDVRVRVEKLRLVKVKSSDAVEYVELGAYLRHMPQGGGSRELAKWRDVDYRGAIAAGKAEDAIGPIEFSFRGNASQCAGGDCWLTLYALVPAVHRYENTGATRFLFSPTSEIAAADAGARTWEGWLDRAQRAGWAGRADEARRAYDEGIAFVVNKHGETSAMHAFMLMRYADFLRAQSQRAEEEKRLTLAVEIFGALDDATIASQIGTDWGQGSAAQELAPRRLAEIYSSQRRHEEALPQFRGALAAIRRLGAKVTPYVLQLRSAENHIGIAASLCSLGRVEETRDELVLARGSTARAEQLMEARWAKLFADVPPAQAHVHRPNYDREKAEFNARAGRIGAIEDRQKAGSCVP